MPLNVKIWGLTPILYHITAYDHFNPDFWMSGIAQDNFLDVRLKIRSKIPLLVAVAGLKPW